MVVLFGFCVALLAAIAMFCVALLLWFALLFVFAWLPCFAHMLWVLAGFAFCYSALRYFPFWLAVLLSFNASIRVLLLLRFACLRCCALRCFALPIYSALPSCDCIASVVFHGVSHMVVLTLSGSRWYNFVEGLRAHPAFLCQLATLIGGVVGGWLRLGDFKPNM